jgi:DNA invertase Pin-like site-specific DNA recombinase
VKRSRMHALQPSDLSGLLYAQYIRESTEAQGDGYGPDSQRRENRAFADRVGFVNSGREYVDYASGTSTDGRIALYQAVEDIRQGLFRVLLVAWTHRIARNTEDVPRLRREILEAGGYLVYANPGFVAGNRDMLPMETFHGAMDEQYSLKLSAVIAAGLQTKFEAGFTNGQPVLGTKHVYIRRDGSLAGGPERNTTARRVVDPQKLPAVRVMLAHYAAHGSYRRTARALNEAGYSTRSGQPFTDSSVHDVVVNPFYGPEEIVLFHERDKSRVERPTPAEQHIFPDDIHRLWEECQRERSRRHSEVTAPLGKRSYPLHPVLRCARCGSDYHGQLLKGQRYSHHQGRECIMPYRIQSQQLEAQLVDLLTAWSLPRNWQSQLQIILRTPPSDDHRERRQRLTRQLEQLRKQHLWDLIDDATFQREARAIRDELVRTPQPVASLDAYRAPADLLRNVGAIVKAATRTDRPDAMTAFREWVRTVFVKIEANGQDLVAIELQPRYRELFVVGVAPKLVSEMCARLDSNQHSR